MVVLKVGLCGARYDKPAKRTYNAIIVPITIQDGSTLVTCIQIPSKILTRDLPNKG